MKRDLRDAVFPALHDLMRADPNVVILHNDLGAIGLDKIRQEFPQRTINVGVAEQNMMGLAGGLASSGKRVFVYGIIGHLMRSWEQIKVCICIPNLPVTILGWGAGLSSGLDGPTHHAVEDVGVMRTLANMTIYNPADSVCAEWCVKRAWSMGTPHYIRLDKGLCEGIYQKGHDFSAGFASLHRNWGPAVISTGSETQRICRGSSHIVDVFRLKPAPLIPDVLLVNASIIDEHHPNGGLFSIIAEQLCTLPRKTLEDKFLGEVSR